MSAQQTYQVTATNASFKDLIHYSYSNMPYNPIARSSYIVL